MRGLLILGLVIVRCASAALAIDASVFVNKAVGNGANTVVSPSFSTTSANELILAFFGWNGGGNSSGLASSGASGAGLTWTLVKRQNTKAGCSEIWRAFATSTLSAQTVTITTPTAGTSGGSTLVIVSFSGVDTTGTGGLGAIGAINGCSPATTGAPTCSLTTTRAASWVFGVGNDWDNSTVRTVPTATQTMVHENADGTFGDDAWVQRQNNTTATSGTSVTINDTAPTGDQYNLAIVEVLPGGAPPPPSATCTISILGAGPC